jgi:hypothetical protein
MNQAYLHCPECSALLVVEIRVDTVRTFSIKSLIFKFRDAEILHECTPKRQSTQDSVSPDQLEESLQME